MKKILTILAILAGLGAAFFVGGMETDTTKNQRVLDNLTAVCDGLGGHFSEDVCEYEGGTLSWNADLGRVEFEAVEPKVIEKIVEVEVKVPVEKIVEVEKIVKVEKFSKKRDTEFFESGVSHGIEYFCDVLDGEMSGNSCTWDAGVCTLEDNGVDSHCAKLD